MNALKNRAKTAAKINVQKALQLDEFRSFRSRYLEFDTNCARPPICTMHARIITQDDELYLYIEIKRILSAISPGATC
jgi:hypothetical protein